MWFKRQRKNRRHARDSVLEVRMRSRDARRARLGAVTALVGAVGGTALGVLVTWQVYQWALQRFVYTNDAYAVRRIELRHQGRLRPDEIRRWAGVQPGINLLAIDLDRVRHDLELNPWIERAEVEAMRPDCLRLAVWEREPRAQVVVWRFDLAARNTWPETNFVDDHGFVLPPLQPHWLKSGEPADFSHLTQLGGIEPAEVNPGQLIPRRQVTAALGLIRAYEASTMYSLVDLAELDVSSPDALKGLLHTGDRVMFGTTDFERQMRRWRSIHDHAATQGRALGWLDLSLTNNLAARWRDPALAPPASTAPAPARPVKPPRTRRQPHV